MDGYGACWDESRTKETINDANGIYYGEVTNGKPNGVGIFSYNDGKICEGQWENGVLHGTAATKYPDGNRYLGTWEKGKKPERVTWTFPDGGSYDGDLIDGKKHGFGILQNADGSGFDGPWINDQRDLTDCFATEYFAGGGKIQTPFRNGKYADGNVTRNW